MKHCSRRCCCSVRAWPAFFTVLIVIALIVALLGRMDKGGPKQ